MALPKLYVRPDCNFSHMQCSSAVLLQLLDQPHPVDHQFAAHFVWHALEGRGQNPLAGQVL